MNMRVKDLNNSVYQDLQGFYYAGVFNYYAFAFI